MLVFRVSHMSGVARVRVCGSASNVHASGSNVLPGKAVCGLPQWQAWRQADNAARTVLAWFLHVGLVAWEAGVGDALL